ncbi:hypothetical protein AUTU_08250 [Aureibacter tunicatorum]|nr:hypothetical protein AUTU_08250 [Aureibacter tunicatorum]
MANACQSNKSKKEKVDETPFPATNDIEAIAETPFNLKSQSGPIKFVSGILAEYNSHQDDKWVTDNIFILRDNQRSIYLIPASQFDVNQLNHDFEDVIVLKFDDETSVYKRLHQFIYRSADSVKTSTYSISTHLTNKEGDLYQGNVKFVSDNQTQDTSYLDFNAIQLYDLGNIPAKHHGGE